ncbi:MAG: hypothetical protein EA397_05790 [Deltaproteobacteria bacterium]|nr:MAG: hypothetical protein EA397_05790 [Deltaproteobacteria bacterium]
MRYILMSFALLGCADVGSESLLTSGMSAVIRGESLDGNSTQVSAILRAGGPTSSTFVKLEGDDALTASVGELEVTLTEASLGAMTSYRGTLPDADPETIFVVSLRRTLDDGATGTTFFLPEPFEILSEHGEVEDTSAVEITWEPSGSSHQVLLEVTGTCIVGGLDELEGDPGSVVIPSEYLDFLGEQPGVSCPVDVRIAKVRGGSLDPGFGEGGWAQGIQSRATTFTLNWQ